MCVFVTSTSWLRVPIHTPLYICCPCKYLPPLTVNKLSSLQLCLRTFCFLGPPAFVITGQLAVGTCEIVMLNRDSSVPRRTIARQTARCACRRGQIAGTTRARPACVDARIVRSRQWCEMAPCMEGEVCSLLFNRSGWTCTRGSGRIKTVTPLPKEPS
uniref:TAFA chemokine like family member 5, like n=1 Tax=Oreochromis aureus TaxID=47969 RepID=A0AAZ1XBD6_OREAU